MRVALEEGLHGRGAPVEDHLHVRVARGPRILDQRARSRLVERVHGVAQPVERLTEGRPPALRPAVVAPGPAPAVAAPPLDAMRAAPRGPVDHPRFHRGRMSREEGRVVGQARDAARLDPGAGRRQRHLPEAVVVAVALAVGRDLNELSVCALVEAGQEARRHRITRAKESVEGDRVGDRPVVEEERERPALPSLPAVRPARIERLGPGPPVSVRLPHAGSLARRQEREAHPLLGQHLEGLAVRGGLGEPHSGRLAPEAMPEVGETPSHLGDLVAPAAERQDRVAIGLRDRVPVSAGHPARPIGFQDRAVDVGTLLLEPRHERGADVEGERGEVVDDVQDPVLRVHAPRGRVGRVAFRGDARVPVVIRGGGILGLDALEPGTLAGRLVEVTVDRDEPSSAHGRRNRSATARACRAGLRPAR